MCLLLAAVVHGQSGSPAKSRTDHAQRTLAAVDLAIIAAESGIMDVSVKAMGRAVRRGPPVSSVDLGGLLSSGNAQSNRRSSSTANTSAQDAATAQTKLAKRLLRLNEVWVQREMDPSVAYVAWKQLILPAGRPNEAFAYAVEPQTTQSRSYGDVSFNAKEPKVTDCGAAVLVQWARDADQLDDLLNEIASRKSLPGSAFSSLLLEVILAGHESSPVANVNSLCERLTQQTKLLVEDPNAELLMGQVWKMLQRVDADSTTRRKLIDAVFDKMKSYERWSNNAWPKFLIARSLQKSIEEGNKDDFKRFTAVALSRYNPLRAQNAEYAVSRDAAFYGEAAKLAFDAEQFALGAGCLRSRSLLAVSGRYDRSLSGQILDPTQSIAKALLKMQRPERYELLTDLAWKMPALGLEQSTRLNVTEHIPAVFVTKLLSDKNPAPWHQVTTDGARSVSLLEWSMRDAIALGKDSEVLDRISQLEQKGSDDAKLARIVLGLARNEPLDLTLLTESDDDGTESLVPAFGKGQPVVPLDIAIVQQALGRDEFREAGRELLDDLLKTALERHQDLPVTWLRNLKFQAERNAGKRRTTHVDLKHWVVSDDVAQRDWMAGQVPTSMWTLREGDAWGHEFGTNVSYLMFRCPLEGDFSISFRAKDGSYEESGTTCGGVSVHFLQYLNRLEVRGIGNRNSRTAETSAMKKGEFTKYRFTREGDSLTLHVGDGEFQEELRPASNAFPFFGMAAYPYRATTFDSLKIEGDITIPRHVAMLSPRLIGWSTRLKGQLLPRIALEPGEEPAVTLDPDENQPDWRFIDGMIESVNHDRDKKANEKSDADEHAASSSQQKSKRRPRYEGLIQYLRPLCDGEKISLEFYHQPGSFLLTPSIGRIAILLSESDVGLHWITADTGGDWTGIDDHNRVVDENAEQLGPIKLNENAWNQLAIRLDGEVVTLRLNGEDVYRRTWEKEAGRKFGLFHDPTKYHVRARNLQLTGDWPDVLPEKLMEVIGTP